MSSKQDKKPVEKPSTDWEDKLGKTWKRSLDPADIDTLQTRRKGPAGDS